MRYLKGLLITAVILGLAGMGTTCEAADTVFGIDRGDWNLTWRLINFGILAYFIVKYGKDPLINFLKGQRKDVKERFDDISGQEQELEALQHEQQELLDGLDAKIADIKKYYHEVGEEEKRRLLERAEETRAFILRDAEAAADREFEEARKAFRSEVVEMAVELAGKRISKKITKKDQKNLIGKYVDQLGSMEVPAE